VAGVPTSPGLVRAKTTERLIAALIPATTATVPAAATAASRVALPALPSPDTARYDHRVALVDDHGRVREASLFALLGWKPGDCVSVTERGRQLLVRADADGDLALDPRGRLRIPDALRKFRSWGAGDALILSACLSEQLLVLSPSSTLDTLVVLDDCA
jgi:bifunctional DNA-binding transcriptional regulator/antitoxin component of YhaV-PrlF toxin-antitoxin module